MTAPAGRGDAVMISPDWPAESGGAGLCTGSDLRAASRFFRRVHFLYVGPPLPEVDGPPDELPPGVAAISFARPAPSPAVSFAASLPKGIPAIAFRYARIGRSLATALRNAARVAGDLPLSVIFEDVPTAALLPRVRRLLPSAGTAVRSQNVMSRAFLGIAEGAGRLEQLAWGIESRRIRRFEKGICRRADRLWAISTHEARTYRELLGVRVDGVLGVGLDPDVYEGVSMGDRYTVLHIGRLDLRKRRGMEDFLRRGWPRVRRSEPRARLLIAGAGSRGLTNEDAGVVGLGRVENDIQFLGRGGIFLNPQAVGSGVQIKSVVALLAGKALVATPMAAEGLEGVDGVHYVVGQSPEDAAAKILELMVSPGQCREMARAGRVLAVKGFDHRRVESDASSLFEDLAGARTTLGRGFRG